MIIKYTSEEKRKMIIDYIRKHPKATYKKIRKDTKLHPERIFKKGLKEGFVEAGIKPPRNFDLKTKEEKRKMIIDYIRKHPKAGGHTIIKETKINLNNVFKNIEDAYKSAGVQYPRKIDQRSKEEKINLVLNEIKKDPLINTKELAEKLKLNPYKYFKNLNEIYEKAGLKDINHNEKRKIKKQKTVIGFIKNNPLSTQREINKNCKTHVQNLFNRGIFEAYEKARIKFPFERLKIYGVGIRKIRKRAKDFESEIAIKLSGYGKINRLVKTKRGFADIILERKNKKAIIEVKDYCAKDISISQINQLNKYLEDCACNIGFLICRKKPKKDKFLIGKNRIIILTQHELDKIPNIMRDRCVG